MEIIHLSVDTPMQVHDSVCALGFFDGVHLGHQQLLKEVEHIAKEKGLKKAIMTFSVHPKQILENNDYHYLMSLSEKINILKQWQFDYFYIIDFLFLRIHFLGQCDGIVYRRYAVGFILGESAHSAPCKGKHYKKLFHVD